MSWPIDAYERTWGTREFMRSVRPLFAGRVLDVGGGTQKYRSLIISSDRIQEYRVLDIAAAEGVDIVADAHAMPLPDGSFDTLVCNQVLEHVHDPAQVMRELARVCHKDGRLILSVPFMVGVHPCPHDYFRFTVEGVQAIAEPWFTPERIMTYGGLDQVLLASDVFSEEYSYERFLGLAPAPVSRSRLSKMRTRIRRRVWQYVGRRCSMSSIYSNIGCVLRHNHS